MFEDVIPADMSKIEKVRVDRKIWILKRKKQLINLSQNDPKKIQLNFYGISTKKKLFHKFDTKDNNLLSFAFQNCYQKTLSYSEESTCQKSLGKWTRFTFQIFLAKCVLFSGKITLELHPNKLVLLRRLPNTGMEKEKVIGNPIILRRKSYALGFYCPQWSEMSPKSLWNDKFD